MSLVDCDGSVNESLRGKKKKKEVTICFGYTASDMPRVDEGPVGLPRAVQRASACLNSSSQNLHQDTIPSTHATAYVSKEHFSLIVRRQT